MTLLALILIPLLGGLLALGAARWGASASRWVALLALAAGLALAMGLWLGPEGPHLATGAWPWHAVWPWLPALGIRFHLAMDGLALLLVLLTFFLGMAAVAASWGEVRERVGWFHLCLLWVLGGVVGLFLSADLFLFYVFWELMLVPMYFLIAFWGHERRQYAATKFFLFTQAGSLLLLLAILGLAFAHWRQAGAWSFDYFELLNTPLSRAAGMALMLGFFIAFAVKIPALPLHTWLADAHTEAPTAGSVVLAGLLLKTGAYGLLRFVLPLFPDAARAFAPTAMALGAAGVVYGAVLAFAQSDLKRLVAYTSVSHMGFVLLGVFAGNAMATQGVVLQLVCHGASTGALFVIAGALQERLHTRDWRRMGGLWSSAPRLGGLSLFFALASMGLPGLGNFAAEFLVLAGSFQASVPATVVAATGMVASAVYALGLVHRVFQGQPAASGTAVADCSRRESLILGALLALLVWLGIHPQPCLRLGRPEPVDRPVNNTLNAARDGGRP